MADFVYFLSFCCPSNWSDKHGQEHFLYQGECRESCPAGHYSAKGHICLPCPDNCELCHNPRVCTRCTSGYFLVPTNHSCQKLECGQGKVVLTPLPNTRRWEEGLYPVCPRDLNYTNPVGTMVAAPPFPPHTSSSWVSLDSIQAQTQPVT